MATVELYYYPSCTSCRKADDLLRRRRVDAIRRDFFKSRFSPDELAALLARIGVTAHEVLSTRAKAYTGHGLDRQTLSGDELIALMCEHPTLLRRPITVVNDTPVVGFNRLSIEALLD